MKFRLAGWPLALILAFLLASACGGAGGRADKSPHSALWVATGSALEFAQISRLESLGVSELFVESGRLSFAGGQPNVELLATLSLPRRTGVTLVISGSWTAAKLDPEVVAASLAAELHRVGAAARERGLEPLGFHFDLVDSTLPPSVAPTMAALRQALEPGHYLSASLRRAWLSGEEGKRLAEEVDFVVPLLYGQRPGEREDSSAWDLRKVEQNLRTLDRWGRPYFIGVITLSRAFHLGRAGEPLAETTRFDLAGLVRNRSLELAHGFSLDAIDRQAYRFTANGPLKVAGFELSKGQSVSVLGLSSYHVEEFLRVVGALDLKHHLGELYFRLSNPEERMSLSLANLESALDPEPSHARPHLKALSGAGTLTIELTNLSDERSDIMLLGGNYVELRLEGGSFGSVDPGDFFRWELLEEKGGQLVRAFRNAKILRLHAPLLEAQERLKSGTIRFSGGKVKASGSFVVPGGTVVAAEVEGATP